MRMLESVKEWVLWLEEETGRSLGDSLKMFNENAHPEGSRGCSVAMLPS